MNPAQGIAEAADLIQQTRTKSPEQAGELLKKTLDGLSETNADRLRKMMRDTDGSESLSIRIPRGKGSQPVPLPEGPATPTEIDKALEKAGQDLERLSRNPDFQKSPIGQAIMGSRILQQWLKQQAAPDTRTDVAEPLPDREGFPTHEGDEEDGKLAGDAPAPNTPDREELLPHDIDNTVPGTPDQSDQMGQGTILEMAKNRERRHLEYLAKKWGMDYHDLSENLHALKEHHGLGGREVEFDVETGDIFDPLSAERLSLGVIKSDNPKRAKGRDNRERHQKKRH